MLSKNILFKNFKKAKVSKKISLNLKKLLFKKNQILFSLSNEYKDKYNIKKIKKLKKNINTRVIGMGGSILGSKAIYSFLRTLTSKNFSFFDNLDSNFKPDKKKYLNLKKPVIWSINLYSTHKLETVKESWKKSEIFPLICN